MKKSQFILLLAGILSLPLSSARRRAVSSDVTPTTLGPTQATVQTNAFSNTVTRFGPSITNAALLDIPADATSIQTGNSALTSAVAVNDPIVVRPQVCHHDNCLRELLRYSAVFDTFCKTYTSTNRTATQAGATPTNCPGDAARTSSACTCLGYLMATSNSASSASPTTSKALFPASSSVSSRSVGVSTSKTYYAGNTTTILPSQNSTTSRLTYTTISPSGNVSTTRFAYATTSTKLPSQNLTTTLKSTVYSTKYITLGTGTGTAVSQGTHLSIPTVSLKWTNSTTLAASTKTKPLPTNVISSSNTTTTSVTKVIAQVVASGTGNPSVVGWSTLPANEGIRDCHQSEVCQEAADIFENCVNRIPNFENNTLTAACLCNPANNWKQTTTDCLKCTEKFLPVRVTPNAPPSTQLALLTGRHQDAYCSSPSQPFYRDLSKFLRVGQNHTALFQSPIHTWNMRLLNNPVPAVKGYNDKLYVFEKQEEWATFPIGKRSKKVFDDCLAGETCKTAIATFNECMTGAGSSDTWSCFCTLPTSPPSPDPKPLISGLFAPQAGACAQCLAYGLPALNSEGYPADLFGPVVEAIVELVVCEIEEKSLAKANAVRYGLRTTEVYESPVLLFNFTLMEKQLEAPPERKRDGNEVLVRSLVEGLMS